MRWRWGQGHHSAICWKKSLALAGNLLNMRSTAAVTLCKHLQPLLGCGDDMNGLIFLRIFKDQEQTELEDYFAGDDDICSQKAPAFLHCRLFLH